MGGRLIRKGLALARAELTKELWMHDAGQFTLFFLGTLGFAPRADHLSSSHNGGLEHPVASRNYQ